MNENFPESDPLNEDHTDSPNVGEQVEDAAQRTTEVARDNVWLVTLGLFLVGIAIGAAATRASTPELNIRNATERSLRRAGKRSQDFSRRMQSRIPSDFTMPSVSDRLDNLAGHLRFW
ncbi:MAG: CopD family protein [Chthoniobacterales bacterium]